MAQVQIAESKDKIRLDNMYPYTYVRANVMRTKLFRRNDYEKMLKMQFSELAKFLQDSSYKAEIDELAVMYSGEELIEMALTRNLAKTFAKLRRISTTELNLLIDAYLTKYDILNVKTIVRGIYTSADKDYIKRLLVPAGAFREEFLYELLKKDSVEDVVRAVPFLEYKHFRKFIEDLKEKGALYEFENALDQHYFRHLISFSEMLPVGGELFKNFIETQIEATNLLNIVKLIKEGAPKSDMKKSIFLTASPEKNLQVLRLLESKSIDSIPKGIRNKAMRKFINECVEHYHKNHSLIEFERLVNKHVLGRAMLFIHQNPLSINVILGFMFAKEIEVQNLMKIVKGRQLGFSEEFISREIIV